MKTAEKQLFYSRQKEHCAPFIENGTRFALRNVEILRKVEKSKGRALRQTYRLFAAIDRAVMDSLISHRRVIEAARNAYRVRRFY